MAPRAGEYRRFGEGELPFPKGARVRVTKRISLYFEREGEVVAIGTNKNIRLVKIPGVRVPVLFLVSELE